MTTLSARTGYALWAPTYDRETVVSALEDESVRALTLPSRYASLLDVGCGTARRLADVGGTRVVGIDVTPEMLYRADRCHDLIAADARAIPFASGAFERVWCRLAIGHIAEHERVYSELSRVCAPGGHVVVTDFHPDAVAAGHRRTFRDAEGGRVELEHHVHTPARQRTAAARHGLELVAQRDAVVGPSVEALYRDAGAHAAYAAQRGLALVLVLVFRRLACAS
jgi:malonyl-CoA O-methyltransferase